MCKLIIREHADTTWKSKWEEKYANVSVAHQVTIHVHVIACSFKSEIGEIKNTFNFDVTCDYSEWLSKC